MKRTAIISMICATGLSAAGRPASYTALNIRFTLNETAETMGWSQLDIREQTGDPGTAYILSDQRGVLSATVYPSERDVNRAWQTVDTGDPVDFHGRAARQAAPSDNIPLGAFMWKETNMIVSVAISGGEALQAASLLYTNLQMNGIIPGWTLPDVDDIPDIEDTPPSRTSVSIGPVTLKAKALYADIDAGSLPANTVVMAELEHLRSGHVLEKVPVIVLPDGKQSMRFKEPILGWNPGAYEIRMLHDSKTIATKNIIIDNGRLVHE